MTIRELFIELGRSFLPEVHYAYVELHRFDEHAPAERPLCVYEAVRLGGPLPDLPTIPLLTDSADDVTCEACREELRRATR